jgi:hypothetical protein
MRWTNNDTQAYRTVTDMGERLRKQWEDAQAAQAYKDATQVTDATASGDEALNNFRSNYVPQEGGPATADEYMQQNPASFEGLSTRKGSYRMGGQEQETAFTPQQKRVVGLQAMADHYSARGNDEQALRYGTMYDQAESAGLQRKIAQHQIDRLPKQDALQDLQLEEATQEQAVKKMTRAFYTAAAKGRAGLTEFYKNMMPDGWDDLEERPVKGGGFELVQKRIGKDGKPEYGASIGKFEDEGDMYRQAMTKAPGLIEKALTLQQAAEREKNDKAKDDRYLSILEKKIGATGGAGRQTASEALKEKASALANAYLNADDTGKLTREQATKRAWQVLVKDPEARQGRPSMTDLKAAEEVLRLRNPEFDRLSPADQEAMRNEVLGIQPAANFVVGSKALTSGTPLQKSGLRLAPSKPFPADLARQLQTAESNRVTKDWAQLENDRRNTLR